MINQANRRIRPGVAPAAVGVLSVVALLFAVSAAQAQQMGRDGWSFSNRNKSMAAQFDFTQRMQQSSSGDGIAAFQQFVTNYNSSSTSIGNMNQVTQNLSNGSNGSVSNGANQASNGNQGSEASTQTTVDNSVQQHNTTPSNTPNQN